MRRVMRFVVPVVAVVLVVTLCIRVWPNSSTGAGATPTTTNLTPTVTGFYLSIGASASLGFQPTGIPAHNGHRTATGYVNDVVAMEAAKGVALTLRQIGCPAETWESMLSAGDACYKLPNRQLVTALRFLRNHHGDTGLVTIEIGFNDIRKCLWPATLDRACVTHGLAMVRATMAAVLAKLVAAAGPHVHLVGVLYADPFLAHSIKAYWGGATSANATVPVIFQLNQALISAYRAQNIPIANVPGAYKMGNTTPASLPDVGPVPQNVASTCTLTWMCHGTPYGPDDHPNNAGYQVIADAIVAVLPTTW